MTRTQKIILLAGAGAAAVAAGAAYALSKKKGPPPAQFTIALTSGASEVQAGQSVSFNALVSDQSGIPQGGAPVSVLENGSKVRGGTTDSAGSYAFSLSFPAAGAYDVQVVSGRLVSNFVRVTVTSQPPPPLPACPGTLQLQLTTGGAGVAALLPAPQAFSLFQAGGCQAGFNPSFWAMWAAGDYADMPAVYDCGTDSFDDIADIPALLGCSWGPFTCLPHRYISACGWAYTSSGTCVT